MRTEEEIQKAEKYASLAMEFLWDSIRDGEGFEEIKDQEEIFFLLSLSVMIMMGAVTVTLMDIRGTECVQQYVISTLQHIAVKTGGELCMVKVDNDESHG